MSVDQLFSYLMAEDITVEMVAKLRGKICLHIYIFIFRCDIVLCLVYCIGPQAVLHTHCRTSRLQLIEGV